MTLRRNVEENVQKPSEQNDHLLDAVFRLFPRELSHPAKYRKRSFIYHQGADATAVYCLLSGTVALQRLDEQGRVAMFGLLKAGAVLSWHDVIDGGCHRNSAEALSCCEVAILPCKPFASALYSDGQLLEALMRQTAAQVSAYEEHIVRLSTPELSKRIYSTLCAFAEEDPAPSGNEETVEFSVPFLKRDLAAMTGTSPESLSRSLRRLEAMDLAEFHGRDRVRLRKGWSGDE